MKKTATLLNKGFSTIFFTLISAILIAIAIFVADKLGFLGDLRGRASGTTYYVDCNAGSDADGVLGTSESTAWKTVERANRATLAPGDKLLFKRGCVWTKRSEGVYLDLNENWNGNSTSHITIGAYGVGALPIIQSDARGTGRNQINVDINGSYIDVENIHTRVINPYHETLCRQADGTGVPLGWYVGFSINGHHNTLSYIETSQMSIGVNMTDNSKFNKVSHANMHDLNALWRINKTVKALGGLGVNLHGDDNEVEYSLFESNGAQCNYVDDGMDQNYSAPFEIYNANRAYVHHNKAFEHRKHFEMGKATDKTSTGNVLAYNLFVSSKADARGPNIHGASNPFGPINNTQVYNNTFVFTGAGSEAIICTCDGGATVKNNIFVAESKAAYYSGNVAETNNIYWDYRRTTDSQDDPLVQFSGGGSLNSSSAKVDPQFVNLAGAGGDYHLKSTSPGLDKGVSIGSLLSLLSNSRLLSILNADLDQIMTPQGVSVEIGSYEFPVILPSPSPSPSPSPTPTAVPTPTPTQTATPAPTTQSGVIPSITITNPQHQSFVDRGSVVQINAVATDDIGIKQVEFFINGDNVYTDTQAPYTYTWKVSNKPRAEYELRAKATNTSGNVKNAQVTVTSQ